MKKKLTALVVVALFVCGVAIYVHASSDASSTELSISSCSEAAPLASDEGSCSKKAESDGCPKSKDSCPKSDASKSDGCPKSKDSCPKSDASKSDGCPKSKDSCPKS